MSASTDSAINSSLFQNASFAPTASFELFKKAIDYAKENKIVLKSGNVLTTDSFYNDDKNSYKKWAEYGVLCVEMETATIYTIAAKFGIQALSLLTISDSLLADGQLSHEQRESSFEQMVDIALNIG